MCGHVRAESGSDRFLDPLMTVLGFCEGCGVWGWAACRGPPGWRKEERREERKEREERKKESNIKKEREKREQREKRREKP